MPDLQVENSANLTPMMRQYYQMRERLSDDTLLMFRLGDFYEMFGKDAEVGARILGITLTQRHTTPMAGIPYHAADGYVNKLLQAGKKVAMCEQMNDPKPGKLVERALTRILTPGTTLQSNQLEAQRNHNLLALQLTAKGLQASWLDLSTGEFAIAHEASIEKLLPLLYALDPKELLIPESYATSWPTLLPHAQYEDLLHYVKNRPHSPLAETYFDPKSAYGVLLSTLKVLTLDGFGIANTHPALSCAGALIHYCTESLSAQPENLRMLKEVRTNNTLLIDSATLKNLEIFSNANHARQGSLIGAIDRTLTAPGARLLEQWLAAPLLDVEEINRRLSCVETLIEEPSVTAHVQELLRKVRDIPRILGRLQNRLQSPRELGAVAQTLEQLPQLSESLNAVNHKPAIAQLQQQIHLFPDLQDLLKRALKEDLPTQVTDGGFIQDGFDAELDRLRSLMSSNMNWIADLEAREQTQTGIKNLKIKYNPTFGYYIEVTKSNLNLVPQHYMRKQTMTNAERFCTDELKSKEKEILHAEEYALAREQELFKTIVDSVLAHSDNLTRTAQTLAQIDLFAGWAHLAREWDYTKPEVDNSEVIEVEQGRHPVIEQMLKENKLGLAGSMTFVPNDTQLAANGEQIILITGPNMAGKSTYIRQVALITLMAQIGCYVPATRCRIGIVDRIFSRVGASDELARGNSTFMVEMNETANILNNATHRSLIILDEIGRGTSTYDGLSIAWAVLEHLHGSGQRGPKTLFATHYHEMTQLEKILPRVCNYSVAVKEWNDEIIFVRQVVRGAADRSYGIQVARLAGLPGSVITRAKEILNDLESGGAIHLKALPAPQEGQSASAQKSARRKDDASSQLQLF